jgi:hypothetical protein
MHNSHFIHTFVSEKRLSAPHICTLSDYNDSNLRRMSHSEYEWSDSDDEASSSDWKDDEEDDIPKKKSSGG